MTADTPAAAPEPPAREPYPVFLEARCPERQRRLTNIPIAGTAIRYILAVPQAVIVAYLVYAGILAYFAATFVILFRGRYPRGLFKLLVGIARWQLNVTAYQYHLFDDYPPADLDQREGWWTEYGVLYPRQPSRFLNFPFLGLLLKLVLLTPHVAVVAVLGWLALVVSLIATVAILFTGRYPLGLHRYVTGVLRWQYRLGAYAAGFTDRYPPFGLE